jgi:hypothetical protein
MRVGNWLVVFCGLLLLASFTAAQPPGGQGKGKGKGKGDKIGKGGDKGGAPQTGTVNELVDRMMAFDKDGDGKLTKDEVTDERLHRLFDQADANKDGVVTRDELSALATQLQAQAGQGGGRGGPGGPPDGPGGRGRGGRGGPDGFGGPGRGGPGGFGGPPQPGQILPPPVQDMLNVTAEQKKQLDELQKDVDDKLAKILTDEQKQQLRQMQDGFGPGGRGRRGGRGPGG